MAYVRTVPPRDARGETAEVYRYMAEVAGAPMVAKIVQLFSLRPASMRAMIRGWELSMWAGDEPRPMRELVGAMVSRLNDCHYWIDAHEAFLQAAGGEATRAARLLDGTAPDATPLERALVDLVRKTSAAPARLGPADLDPLRALVGDGALDYAHVAAMFHFINRVADLLHVDPEVLPAGLRRVEPLRRVMVRGASLLMRRMDLRPRPYTTTYEDALAALARLCARIGRPPPGHALLPLHARPKLIEAIRLRLEERERASLDRETLARVDRAVEAALPARAEDAEGFHARPQDPVEAFAFVGTRYAQRTTDETIAALRRAGFDDLGILDLAIAVADANQWARTRRLTGVPADLFLSAS